MKITPICALRDNYIWCLKDDKQACIIVDPGEAEPVLSFLRARKLKLKGILVTHHHYDHTGGIAEILNQHIVPVIGSEQTPSVSMIVSNGDLISIDDVPFQFQVLAVPGHTLDHLAYYQEGIVLTGDTLFTAGCGKIFEGTAQQMYDSLQKLKNLPDHTNIYCGHEYTQANLSFALKVESNNEDISRRLKETIQLRQEQKPTVPASLALEKKTNPFLRCDQKNVIEAASNFAQRPLYSEIEVLASLREWKNQG